MVEYCDKVVLVLEEVYQIIKPYITHNTHFGVKNGTKKYCCPNCGSGNVLLNGTDVTAAGTVKRRIRCKECKTSFYINNKMYVDFVTDRARNKANM